MISLVVLKEEIEIACGRVSSRKLEEPILYTPRCKGIVERARIRARERGGRTEVEDLLLELLAEKEGIPASLIRKRAIDVDSVILLK